MTPHHRRLVTRNGGDEVADHHCRLVTRAGGDDGDRCQFVLPTGGDEAVQDKTPTPSSLPFFPFFSQPVPQISSCPARSNPVRHAPQSPPPSPRPGCRPCAVPRPSPRRRPRAPTPPSPSGAAICEPRRRPRVPAPPLRGAAGPPSRSASTSRR